MRYLSFPLLFLVVPLLAACGSDVLTEPDSALLRADAPTRSMAGHSGADVRKELAVLRQATERFHDPAAAMEAGYVMDECIAAEDLGAPAELGAMGYHFVNMALIDGTFDPLEPELLVYERRGGALHLVAVEYLYVGEEAPEFAGEVHFHAFPLPFADFALHAWIWKANPAGMFAEFNPNVSCPAD